jgi:hypothetical protein
MGDSVDHDIRILGERNWRNLALNREEWRTLLKEGSCEAVEPMMMTYTSNKWYIRHLNKLNMLPQCE